MFGAAAQGRVSAEPRAADMPAAAVAELFCWMRHRTSFTTWLPSRTTWKASSTRVVSGSWARNAVAWPRNGRPRSGRVRPGPARHRRCALGNAQRRPRRQGARMRPLAGGWRQLAQVRRAGDIAGRGNRVGPLAGTKSSTATRPVGDRCARLPEKTPLPKTWPGERIMHEISDVATDQASVFRTGRGGSTIVTGTRNGVDICVISATETSSRAIRDETSAVERTLEDDRERPGQ